MGKHAREVRDEDELSSGALTIGAVKLRFGNTLNSPVELEARTAFAFGGEAGRGGSRSG